MRAFRRFALCPCPRRCTNMGQCVGTQAIKMYTSIYKLYNMMLVCCCQLSRERNARNILRLDSNNNSTEESLLTCRDACSDTVSTLLNCALVVITILR